MRLKTPKTIAVDLTPILPGGENGGAKILTLTLVKALAKLAPQTQFLLLTQFASHQELKSLETDNIRCLMVRHDSSVLKSSSWAMRALLEVLNCFPGRVKRLAMRFGYRLKRIMRRLQASRLMKEIEADLLFCPFTAPTYHTNKIPTVCTVYDEQYRTYTQFFSTEDLVNRDRAFIEACRLASSVATISDYSKQAAIQHCGIVLNKIRTIYPRLGHRFNQSNLHSETVLNRLSLRSTRYLIYPANFWKHKNHEMLLTAFGIACRTGLPPDIKLVISGTPNTRQALLVKATQAMGFQDRVVFTGYALDDDLAVLISNAGGMIFPSLYEGFGLPIIEAMAAGIPVGCSNSTALPEIAAESALLFDPHIPSDIAGAMIRLIEDEVFRSHSVKTGLKRAEVFSDTDRMAKEYWDLFEEALA